MKKEAFMWIVIAAIAFMGSCAGDHSSRHGKDTAQQKYQTTPTVDSSKVTTTTGDATNLDNSGSGGTKAIRDTVKK